MPQNKQKPVVPDMAVIDAMERYGGGFVSALAVAWRRADGDNGARLALVFHQIWDQYYEMAARDAGVPIPESTVPSEREQVLAALKKRLLTMFEDDGFLYGYMVDDLVEPTVPAAQQPLYEELAEQMEELITNVVTNAKL